MSSKDRQIKTYFCCEGICWICGEKIENIMSMTLDHVIPRSYQKGEGLVMAAHYFCNKLKENNSIIETAKLIEIFRKDYPAHIFKRVINSPDNGREVAFGANPGFRYEENFKQALKKFEFKHNFVTKRKSNI